MPVEAYVSLESIPIGVSSVFLVSPVPPDAVMEVVKALGLKCTSSTYNKLIKLVVGSYTVSPLVVSTVYVLKP